MAPHTCIVMRSLFEKWNFQRFFSFPGNGFMTGRSRQNPSMVLDNSVGLCLSLETLSSWCL